MSTITSNTSVPREDSGFDTEGARQPVWIERDSYLLPATQPAYPKLTSNTSSDVLVVGGGITGLQVAYELLNKGKKVIIIDDGKIGSGASGRLAGIVDVDNKFEELNKTYGAETTSLIAQSQQEAITHLSSIISTHKISCDHQTLPSYLLDSTSIPPTSSNTASPILNALNIAKTTSTLSPSLSNDAQGQALKIENQATIHPVKYLTGLAGAIKGLGGEIYEGSHYENHKEMEGKVLVDLENGVKVVAGSLVLATGTPPNRISLELQARPYRTYLIALKIPTSSAPSGIYTDTASPRHTVRVTPSKDEGYSYLVVGGEDAKTGQHNDGEERYARLEAWARERWSEVGEVGYKWSHQVMATNDGIAYSGRNPGENNVYIHTADNGHPIIYGIIGGQVISDLIVKGDHPLANLYSPGRQQTLQQPKVALSTIPSIVGEYIADQTNLGKWATMATKTMKDIEDLVPGEGEVVREGITPLAVYKDEGGEIHKMSAICPHLKGMVAWNSSEKSWDCPLHGSRFSCKGMVMNGPSKTGLELK